MPWPSVPDAALAALLGATVTGAVGLYWNFRSAKSNRKLPFLQKQLELCFEASEIVATLATTTDREAFDRAEARFWQLYMGPLAIVEDDAVAGAMIDCGQSLIAARKGATLPVSSMEASSLQLSAAIRRLLIASWKIADLNAVLDPKAITDTPAT